jgi:hypothetical protein
MREPAKDRADQQQAENQPVRREERRRIINNHGFTTRARMPAEINPNSHPIRNTTTSDSGD